MTLAILFFIFQNDDTNNINTELQRVSNSLSELWASMTYRPNVYVYATTRYHQSGIIPFTYSELNCTKRPNAILAMPNNFIGFIRYDFENSTDGYVRIYVVNSNGNLPEENPVSFSMAVYPVMD